VHEPVLFFLAINGQFAPKITSWRHGIGTISISMYAKKPAQPCAQRRAASWASRRFRGAREVAKHPRGSAPQEMWAQPVHIAVEGRFRGPGARV
jgi:hypothetical protein